MKSFVYLSESVQLSFLDRKLNFKGSLFHPGSRSAALFFVIILTFIKRAIFEIKIHEKNPWDQKISFLKFDFHETT